MIKFLLLLLMAPSLSAVTFKIDYTYDTNGFFGDPNDPNDGFKERRDAIEAVAAFFSEIMQDEFLQIDNTEFNTNFTWDPTIFHPGTGNLFNLPQNMVIAANEVPVFVGARDLPGTTLGTAGPGGFSNASGNQAWFDRIRYRGEEDDDTDFSPWGGSISFDTPRNWNFSLTQNQTGSEFVTVALHEFCHLLGIGTADSWEAKINGSDIFTGAAVLNSLGSSPSVQVANTFGSHGHFISPTNSTLMSLSYGSFGAQHGGSQRVTMLPSLSDNGSTFLSLSDLDLAALIDIGWEIQVPVSLDTFALSSSLASMEIATSSFIEYQLTRSLNLSNFTNIGGQVTGNGDVLLLEDTSAPAERAFYQVEATPVFPATDSGPLLQQSLQSEAEFEEDVIRVFPGKVYEPVTGCNCAHELSLLGLHQ